MGGRSSCMSTAGRFNSAWRRTSRLWLCTSLYGAAALVPLILLAPACGHGDVEDISDNPDMLLSEGGFSSPDLGMRLVGGPLTDAEGWAHRRSRAGWMRTSPGA